MSDHRPPHGVFWLIAGLLFAINLSIMTATKRIERQISNGNGFYLCVESLKLGVRAKKCDELLATPNTPDMEKVKP